MKYTIIQFDKIGHTLGINVHHAYSSKSKKDKILPDKFYRNYYNYGRVKDESNEPEWVAELSDYIDKWTQSGNLYFQINEKGINLFRKQFKEEITDTYIPLSRSKQKYQDFIDADLGIPFSEFIGIKPKSSLQ